jgi:SAM-dependent methyltransferase
MGLAQWGVQRRAKRALVRQLEFQRRKADYVRNDVDGAVSHMVEKSRAARAAIESVRPIPADARVLEVGCGSMGLIFFFGAKDGIGVDPLADHYADLFPVWYGRSRTIAAFGEALPFSDASFDIVLCDNVVDHAEGPRQIVEEIARVLAPGGLLYFTVNVHHPLYHAAATAHAAWRSLGIPFEVRPFADHTVHLTFDAARGLFDGLPLRPLRETESVAEARSHASRNGLLQRLFFKNGLCLRIMERTS